MPLWGGIEAGGTKFVCAVADDQGSIQAESSFPTTSPEETLRQAIQFLKPHPFEALGIASFGPLDLDPKSPSYGHITSTPKPGWEDTDIVGAFADAFGIPVGFDTDVNGAALGEWRWGAAQGLEAFIYLTIGTGIGGGMVINGEPLHGLMHPEMGHMLIPHDHERDPFPGNCPFHGDCLEGLASGPAIQARWGQPAETLPDDHPAWALEADYLAAGLVNFICALSPQRILMGGGVMQQGQLFPMIQERVLKLLGGYIQAPALLAKIDDYIVPPGLGKRAGVLGAVALAQAAHRTAAIEKGN